MPSLSDCKQSPLATPSDVKQYYLKFLRRFNENSLCREVNFWFKEVALQQSKSFDYPPTQNSRETPETLLPKYGGQGEVFP